MDKEDLKFKLLSTPLIHICHNMIILDLLIDKGHMICFQLDKVYLAKKKKEVEQIKMHFLNKNIEI